MAQVDCFLKIDGVSGESTDKDHKAWSDLASFSFGCSHSSPPTIGSRRKGSPAFDDLVAVKTADAATPQIQLLCATGKRIPQVTLEVVFKEGETIDEWRTLTVDIFDVSVSSAKSGVVANSSSLQGDSVLLRPGQAELTQGVGKYELSTSAEKDMPVEAVSFNFVKIEWTYQGKGREGERVMEGYNLKENIKV